MATCDFAPWPIPPSGFDTNDELEAPIHLRTQTDDALVEAVKAGNTALFAELVRRYQRFCLSKANSILRNWDDSEDEVQNAWIQVWTHLESYRGQGSFGAWLSRIVSNRCLMRLRKTRYAPTTSVDEVFDSEGSFRLEVIDQRARPDQVLRNDEVLRLLSKEIDGVPPLLREVLIMRDVRQLVIGDIAAGLGISIPAAKSRLMRARLELKRRLERHCGTGSRAVLENPGGALTAYVRAS
jgi:RNA polymerase sigma-70 factor, ECF subfamily